MTEADDTLSRLMQAPIAAPDEAFAAAVMVKVAVQARLHFAAAALRNLILMAVLGGIASQAGGIVEGLAFIAPVSPDYLYAALAVTCAAGMFGLPLLKRIRV